MPTRCRKGWSNEPPFHKKWNTIIFKERFNNGTQDLVQSTAVITFHSGRIWGEQMTRTPRVQPATSTLRDDSSDFGPKRCCCWNKRAWSAWRHVAACNREWERDANHEVFPTEDDPETEERGVEDALLDIFKQQHPRPLKAQREPLHRHVQERHRDPQGQYYPEQGKYSPTSILHNIRTYICS